MKARKQLGQHFITDRALLGRIAAASRAAPGDVVLEIGPGPGGLTAALLERGCTVLAIERDPRMAATLLRQFGSSAFVLVEGDALALDWPGLVAPWTTQGATWRIVGNIPYNITSPLLEKALTPPMPASVTFLVQEEVASRLAAKAGDDDYGALTVGIAAAARAEMVMRVGRGAFTPPPRVDSAVVHLVPHDAPPIAPDRIGHLRRMVVSLFSYRRKRIMRALREATGLPAEDAGAVLVAAGIDPDVRPEVVTPEQFVALLDALERRDGTPDGS